MATRLSSATPSRSNGLVIAGYELLDLISNSRTSAVYRALQTADGRPVVIKIPHRHDAPSRAAQRCRREFEILSALTLSGVIRSYALLEQHGSAALVLEPFDGISLQSWLAVAPRNLATRLRVAAALARTVTELHAAGVSHRSISSTNILIDPTSLETRLVDFADAARIGAATKPPGPRGILDGSLAYISPEQTGRTNRSVDERTDLYSLGICYYELFANRLPFRSPDPLDWIHFHLAGNTRPLTDFAPETPAVLADIAAKLLHREPEERYQTAAGLAADIDRCRERLDDAGRIEPFAIATKDYSSRFKLPQTLFGRDAEHQALVDAFERAAAGRTERVHIVGLLGSGRSSLARQLLLPTTRRRGFFIAGKCRPNVSSAPFAPIVEALNGLITQLLGESEKSLHEWRSAILAAIGNRGRLLVDVLPNLDRIIGHQPELPRLSDGTARVRFQSAFAAFVGVFARPGQPLVLLLDDMQCADEGTQALVDLLAKDASTRSLLILETWEEPRPGEQPSHHAQRNPDATTIRLKNLDAEATRQLVAAALHQEPAEVAPLAAIVHRKTGGKPLHAHRLLNDLHVNGAIRFDAETRRFVCDLAAASETETTESVAKGMAQQLKELDAPNLLALQIASVIGRRFDIAIVARCLREPLAEVRALFRAARDAGFIIVADDYAFAHDYLQQTTYELVAPRERQTLHLAIGRIMLEGADDAAIERRLLDIVGHFREAESLIESDAERVRYAELNLRAAERMRNATAYGAAERYYRTAIDLLGDTAWQSQADLTFELHTRLAEVLCLEHDVAAAFRVLDTAASNVRSHAERAKLASLKVVALVRRNQPRQALDSGLAALGEIGVTLPTDVSAIDAEMHSELASIMAETQRQPIEALANLPIVRSADLIAQMELLRWCLPASFLIDWPMFRLLCCKLVSLSIRHGNCRWSAGGYASFPAVLMDVIGGYREADRFAELGIQLTRQLDDSTTYPETVLLRAMLTAHWVSPIDSSLEMIDRSAVAARETGDQDTTVFATRLRLAHLSFRGAPLPLLGTEIANALKQWDGPSDKGLRSTLLCRRHFNEWLTADIDSRDEASRAEEERLTTVILRDGTLSMQGEWHLLLLCKRLMSGDFAAARTHADALSALGNHARSVVMETEQVFYTALVLTGLYDNANLEQRSALDRELDDLESRLTAWSALCPENREHMWLLVSAERARNRGDRFEAIDRYDAAINSAARNNFLHVEALAAEAAARFCLATEKPDFAAVYLQKALSAYRRFGASRKVRELVTLRDACGTSENAPRKPHGDRDDARRHDAFDFAAVVKASQAIAREIILEELISNFMDIVLESAGGDHIALILPSDGRLLVQGIRESEDSKPRLMLAEPVDESDRVSSRIVNYVTRTHEHLVLSEPAKGGQFQSDAYVMRRQPKSVLCAPIMNKGELAGVIYIENTQLADAFTPDRLQALDILLSQLAISIENAKLYARQEEQARRIERTNTALTRQIAERKHAENQLSRYRDHLEDLVAQRTREVEHANDKLRSEVRGREEALKKLEQSNEQIRSLAYLDGLTGLPNRRLLNEHLAKILARCKRKGLEFAVLFVDLDNFKLLNDSIGHQAADAVLRELADTLTEIVRSADTEAFAAEFDQPIDPDETISIAPITESILSRLGGDEFVVLLPEIRDRFGAATLAQRILDRLERPIRSGNKEVFIAASIGIATYPEDGPTTEVLLRNADTAMYHAKQLGKATYQYYSDEMNQASVERLTLENGLRKALDENRLELHYQPQVDTSTGRIVGAEALLRWWDPDRGYISPEKFVPVAEGGGLILQIGEWTLQEAARQAVEWRKLGLPNIPVAVNVSAVQFRRQDLVGLVRRVLRDSGLEPSALSIEITETSLMSVVDRAVEVLRQLNELGVGTSLDDFGTGYSSLSYLKAFPLDGIKIDRSFVAEVLTDEKTAALTGAIIDMTRILDLKVVAEGVENESQLRRLKELGCSVVQGFYFSPAVRAQEFARLLTSQPARWSA